MPRAITAVVVVVAALVQPAPAAEPTDLPRVNDARLRLHLIAADPDVVTPIGLAIDQKGRIFVLESHTHSPPRDYSGPRSDRVKVLSLPDASGRSRVVGVFAEGIEDGMNLAFSPAGELHVVTSRSVVRLKDADADGIAEDRSTVMELQTPQRPYEHAALLGIAFSSDGWLYVTRGNVGSLRYTIRANADGSTVSGYGDGGNIVRCRPDGSGVEEVATGFWNPFAVCFGPAGVLFCADNDPDARGPNRLVHVIPGGDYGYKSMYGGGGNHPFQSWNGELPGTLPFVAGLGEAPCGVLHASSAALPDDYRDSVLCTVWGEHNITRARLRPRGVSFDATTELLVEGGQDFRPVAIAADPSGTIYFTDWVRRDYPNHGHGRVWRLWAGEGVATVPPIRPGAREPLVAPPPPADAPAALKDRDPFVRSGAVVELAAPALRAQALAATEHADADVRLGALLALRRGAADGAVAVVRRLLRDPDPRVRQVALVWAGEAAIEDLRQDLPAALGGDVSATLFETYLAATECLSPDFVRALREGKEPYANRLPRRLDPAVVESMAGNPHAPAAVRALALARLQEPQRPDNFAMLRSLLEDRDLELRLEAVRAIARVGGAEARETLARVAASRDVRVAADFAPLDQVRAEAVLALSAWPRAEVVDHLLPLLREPWPAVATETVRALQGGLRDERVEQALLRGYPDPIRGGDWNGSGRVAEQVAFALAPLSPPNSVWRQTQEGRPRSPEQWRVELLERRRGRPGDAASGRRVFYSPRVGCARCHTVHNRGGRLGPDLSGVGRSRGSDKLLYDILRPSDEFSIGYQAWYVKTRDGDTHLGLQLDLKDRGDIELFTTAGRTERFAGDRITSYGALKQSLMPDGLDAGLSVADFADLLAFLESLK